MGLAHNTQRLICRVVLRGCCWLRNTRDSQLARGAAARLLCESGSVATARPCQRTGPCSSLRPNFFALVCPFSRAFFAVVVSSNGLCLAQWPRACAACSSCRSGDAPPRYEQGAEQRFLFFAESQKPRRLLRIDFRLVFRDASLGGARFFVFFFFFVLLSEDNHRRSPHVALHAHFPPTPTPSPPPKNPIRTLCLSNPPIARTHVQATPRTTVGRSVRPQNPFFDDSTHPQHAHATRSGKHAADNVSLRDLRIETADGHLTPEINPRETNSAQNIDRKRQPAKIPRELGPHPTPNTHTNTQHTPTTRLPVRIMGAKQKRVAILQP